MAYNRKPGVDWGAIEAQFRAGMSCREIARQHGNISHEMISRTARKHRWGQADRIGELVLATASLGESHYKASDDRRQRILDSLANGSTLRLAAAAAGIAEATLRLWRGDDPAFATACEAAQAVFAEGRVADVAKASKRGDWRAGMALLERNPITRDDFAPPRTAMGASINVILDIPTPTARDPSVRVIEGEK